MDQVAWRAAYSCFGSDQRQEKGYNAASTTHADASQQQGAEQPILTPEELAYKPVSSAQSRWCRINALHRVHSLGEGVRFEDGQVASASQKPEAATLPERIAAQPTVHPQLLTTAPSGTCAPLLPVEWARECGKHTSARAGPCSRRRPRSRGSRGRTAPRCSGSARRTARPCWLP